MLSFSELNLNPKILKSLADKGYSTPTPIQAQAIPASLEGKDILGIAQTGTGKTAAFSLPILNNLTESNLPVKSGCVRALILTPTRELASQIAENIEAYGKDLGLRHAVIFGGVSEHRQIRALQGGLDILIATPGRLLDLMNQGHVRFMHLEIFVLDEADRMLDMGFINDIKKIIAKIPTKRQTMFFSATMPATISDLAHSILSNPVTIEVTPQATTVERIDQKINFVEKGNKLALLKRILSEEGSESILVFSKTKHGANRIVEFLLKNNIAVAAIHGNKSQAAREKALGSFRDGSVKILVATDIAARGIDIPAISHVINYDIPMDPESYVHRIGRTARAGREGIAISFCDPSERKLLSAVEKTIKYKIPVDETHPFHGVTAPQASKSDEDQERPQRRRPTNGRQYGHSVNKERRIASSERSTRNFNNRDRDDRKPRGERSDSRRGDVRPNDRNRGTDRRSESRPVVDPSKSGLLDFIGLGKKKSYAPRVNPMKIGRDGTSSFRHTDDRRDTRRSATGEERRFSEKKEGGFLSGWFKKSDRSRSEAKDDSFGNRERPTGNSNRSRFGSSSQGGRDGRREGGSSFGGERRSFGDRSNSERKPFGERSSGGRPSGSRPFGGRPSSGSRPSRPSGDRPNGRFGGNRSGGSSDSPKRWN